MLSNNSLSPLLSSRAFSSINYYLIIFLMMFLPLPLLVRSANPPQGKIIINKKNIFTKGPSYLPLFPSLWLYWDRHSLCPIMGSGNIGFLAFTEMHEILDRISSWVRNPHYDKWLSRLAARHKKKKLIINKLFTSVLSGLTITIPMAS